MRPARYLSAHKGFNAGSGSSILRKAQRTTIVQRVFSSNCSAVESSHLKNAATVFNARWISVESACVEVRWIVHLRPLSTIRPMIGTSTALPNAYRGFVFLNRLFAIADRNMIQYAPQFTLKRIAIWHSATIGFGSCLSTGE